MSCQKGITSRSRGQKYQNATAFKNDKYGASPQVKKANAKVHDGLCQRCKDILEWKVKYNKYKFLAQPRKCVKCLQKRVKDAYHIMCKPCALELELCAKCGKKEEIAIPLDRTEGGSEVEETREATPQCSRNRRPDSHQVDEEDEFGDDWSDEGEVDSDSGECDLVTAGK